MTFVFFPIIFAIIGAKYHARTYKKCPGVTPSSLVSSSVRNIQILEAKILLIAMRFIFHVATCLILALLITDTMGVLFIPILKIKALGTLFRAAVGAVIGKRSVDDQRLDVILETEDGDCTKLLVCELAGEKNLSGAEREIVRTFTSGSIILDPSVARYLLLFLTHTLE